MDGDLNGIAGWMTALINRNGKTHDGSVVSAVYKSDLINLKLPININRG